MTGNFSEAEQRIHEIVRNAAMLRSARREGPIVPTDEGFEVTYENGESVQVHNKIALPAPKTQDNIIAQCMRGDGSWLFSLKDCFDLMEQTNQVLNTATSTHAIAAAKKLKEHLHSAFGPYGVMTADRVIYTSEGNLAIHNYRHPTRSEEQAIAPNSGDTPGEVAIRTLRWLTGRNYDNLNSIVRTFYMYEDGRMPIIHVGVQFRSKITMKMSGEHLMLPSQNVCPIEESIVTVNSGVDYFRVETSPVDLGD